MKNIELVDSKDIEYITCEEVTQEEVKDIITYVVPQMEGIVSSLKGYGLAAPQVGIKKKFFIMMNEKNKYDLYFNAKYFKEGSRYKSTEGCLSYDLGKRYNEVKRYKGIKASYQTLDENGRLVNKTEKMKGLRARGFQHETDHCGNGPEALSITIFTK